MPPTVNRRIVRMPWPPIRPIRLRWRPRCAHSPARQGAIITDHRTPFADRWGGWYVNASHGQQKDRSNAVASDPADPFTLETALRPFTGSGYLSAVSDIVALMTFEHQTHMTNLITRVGWESRDA